MHTPNWWYNPNNAIPTYTRFLALLYGGVISLRRFLYHHHIIPCQKIAVPVIVIGNLVAGGSGKTPLVMSVVQWLREQGWQPGIASRGYGRKQAHHARWVTAQTPPEEGGDEPVLMVRKTGVPVRVDRNRARAAQALHQAGCNIIVCDDGLQHYRLARDIEIEVIDAQRGYGNAYLLPAGPLREPLKRALDCDLHVLNLGSGENLSAHEPSPEQWPMVLTLSIAQSLCSDNEQPLSHFSGQQVHAVAGIAHPQRFFQMLRQQGIDPIEHPFPDHHPYQPADMYFDDGLPVLMTEKDAIKYRVFASAAHYAVPLQPQLPAGFWQILQARLSALTHSAELAHHESA